MTAGRVAALLAATAAVAALLVGLRSTAPDAGGERARIVPRVCPASAPAPAGPAWWRADVEEGTLGDWGRFGTHASGDAGGGEFDNGSGRARATRERAHTGGWAARLTLPAGRGGARLFRWRELRAHREVVLRVWLLIPRRYRLTAGATTGRFWNVFQLKSRPRGGSSEPLWFLNMAHPARGRLRLELIWWHRTLEGPHHGQSGFRRFVQRRADFPVGRWVGITARLRQANGFDGVLCVWQDRRLLFALRDVRTSYVNCAVSAWCASNEWSVNNYSDGIAPLPAVIYADDASIAAR